MDHITNYFALVLIVDVVRDQARLGPLVFQFPSKSLYGSYLVVLNTRVFSAWQSHGAGKVAHACQRALDIYIFPFSK